MTNPPSAEQAPPLLDLSRLIAGIRWRRKLLAVLAVLGMVVGALAMLVLQNKATATARIYVMHEDEKSADPAVLAKTDVVVFQTSTIATAAMSKLGIAEPVDDFLDSYAVESVSSNILELTVTSKSEVEATARASALAEAFIANHIQRSEDSTKAKSQAVLELQAVAEAERTKLNDQIAAVSAKQPKQGSQEAADLEAQLARRAELSKQIEELAQRAAEVSVSAPQVAAGTEIIDSPRAKMASPVMSAGLGGVVGLVLGLGLGMVFAAVATVVNDRPVLRADIATHLGASVIAQVPAPKRRWWRWWGRSRADDEAKRVATTLARVIRDAPGPVSLLELGSPQTAATLAVDIADGLGPERTVLVVDDLGDGSLRKAAAKRRSDVRIVDGARD